ncbi:putative colanic acid biosysnthesis UDP-glucose lipid carrier transferase [Flavobacterium fontis]|uniref:Putative colanic acid biosysnthesis UDP-glucose lipid carrier transferase n=1 Tax=Flavobacterium fontis TaxID=1124188 RepID=A0A1M4VVC0_9FLAO|nr:undecaprenyl-phosphate glucose phosphotransferase [Flavobacterium fontis]SHE72908.1 putative colanic acid biosysnthesis UDP-glucose lipid carrier transferase [Flavobacterium fontis]
MHHTGRYSKYIRPISILLDLLVVNALSLYFFRELRVDFLVYIPYQILAWSLIALLVRFYEVYRFTTPVEIISKLFKQSTLFLLLVIAFFPFVKTTIFSGKAIAWLLSVSFVIITGFKYFFFYYLKKYRLLTHNNYRSAVIIGYTPEALNLKKVFETRQDYGYRFHGFFSDKKQGPEIVGKTDELKAFVLEKRIDEIYCSLNEISNEKIKELVQFADEFRKTIKFIPDTKEILSKNLKIDYYELFPVLSLQKTQLHDPLIKGFKRAFDILFSLIVIVCILSWLTPIIGLLILLESRGPIFFKQGRPGLDEKEFFCYKFRSMHQNVNTEQEASRNDPRVTRMGRFMRKTSIDELPQFFNVFLGDMSVVGPRPHLWSQNKAYANKIKKYMVRLYVKPGITGLAQVKGFRGEIETDEDMINRIKYDVFYIENWSFVLDIKIIVQTVINIFKGEEKAY